jgi:hypothetical protein
MPISAHGEFDKAIMFMARHCFIFENGDMLTTMGATWFVSYAYYFYVNSEHTNWRKGI